MAKEPVRRERSQASARPPHALLHQPPQLLPSGRQPVNRHRDKSPILCGPALSRSAVYKAYRYYLDGFNDGKIDSINAVVQYPLTVISDGQAHDVFEFPISPAELKAKTGWHTTVDAEIDVVAVSERKAHVILRNARRVRQDGSLIVQTVFRLLRLYQNG